MQRATWIDLAALALLLSVSAPAYAQSVAMITDVTGKVTAPGAKAALTILSEIELDARLHLDAGARLVAIYLKSGDEYSVTGPAQVQFRSDGLHGLSGGTPVKQAGPMAKAGADLRIKSASVTQAAFVMRAIRTTGRITLLALSGTKILDASPEFRWQAAEPDLTYRFELKDEDAKTLIAADVNGTSFTLPASIRLVDDAAYRWDVSARSADGHLHAGAGVFTVATAALRSEVETLRPPQDAPVSARVAFAAWLAQSELRDEARKYWKVLAAERPDDARLKSLAGE